MVRTFVCGCLCLYVPRIVSRDRILCFKNTFIIIMYPKKAIKLFRKSSVKSPDKLLGPSRFHARDAAFVNCFQAESTKMCVKQQ